MEKYSDYKYPLTIIADRYTGVYSGGEFTAWPLDYWDIPDGPESGDVECQEFWENYDGIVGRGATIQEAADDLFEKMDKFSEEINGKY